MRDARGGGILMDQTKRTKESIMRNQSFATEWAHNLLHAAEPTESGRMDKLDGVGSEVSGETRRARVRSGNTRASLPRKWGGCASRNAFNLAEVIGGQVTTPTTTRVKTRDDNGTALPMQHMIATRRRDERDGESPKSGKIQRRGRKQDAPFTRFASEDEYVRNVTRERNAMRDSDETR